mmetsp:Transcript_2340/g.9032  ORF Transcript_2340/g.9032 Transcript_2340/m.9032 type:complete len:239 (-) Transcript_2340:37-753(-)
MRAARDAVNRSSGGFRPGGSPRAASRASRRASDAPTRDADASPRRARSARVAEEGWTDLAAAPASRSAASARATRASVSRASFTARNLATSARGSRSRASRTASSDGASEEERAEASRADASADASAPRREPTVAVDRDSSGAAIGRSVASFDDARATIERPRRFARHPALSTTIAAPRAPDDEIDLRVRSTATTGRAPRHATAIDICTSARLSAKRRFRAVSRARGGCGPRPGSFQG